MTTEDIMPEFVAGYAPEGLTLEDLDVMCETLVNDGIFYRITDGYDPRPRYGLTPLGERFYAALRMEPIGQA